MEGNSSSKFFESKVLGHPSGLFVLFFTEMWERFSFYGMRVLLVNFLTMALVGYNPGWEWTAENAAALFGTYAMLLYITPIIGGIIADKFIGYRWAVVIGALIMTLGHVFMAMETEASLYTGLGLLVIGTGFFKPTMTSIISEMYKDLPEKKDGAYTIFYMGVNAGAFFGMMLCGYLAEKIGWSWGFGLAGVFMLLGTLQFWLAKPLFGNIGGVPKKKAELEADQAIALAEETAAIDLLEGDAKIAAEEAKEPKRNPFTMIDKVLIWICSITVLAYAINDPLRSIAGVDLFKILQISDFAGQYVGILVGLGLFIYLVVTRIGRYDRVTRDRMIAFVIFAFFTVFFWMAFEQGASSLVIFARDSVQRELIGNSAIIFNIVNALLTIVPLVIITWVLYLLAKRTGKIIPGSNIVLVVCFAGIWGIAGWMLYRDFNTTAYDVSFDMEKVAQMDEKTGKQEKDDDGKLVFNYIPITENMDRTAIKNPIIRDTVFTVGEAFLSIAAGDKVNIITKDNGNETFAYLSEKQVKEKREYAKKLNLKNGTNRDNGIVLAEVKAVKKNWVEITVSWFSILNSFFIIAFASLISKWWDSKYNPSAAMKYGLGLIIMAAGFGLLALGSYGVVEGVKVSMIWLILAYLFHTIGELCLSPVGLSYVSKLVPARMIAFMFGMWYLAIAIGNKLAAVVGGQIENITDTYSMSTFFLIFTIVPLIAGVLVIFAGPLLKRLMHGVK
ncbi:MAG: peptide MFS transporter [Crocinitomicaceae bacterium]|nr:peptide MFS transporter [Flavobacteriales bacterium]NQZ34167.1 peptide MFS transporter [Crocinitomicaceae bacterium]